MWSKGKMELLEHIEKISKELESLIESINKTIKAKYNKNYLKKVESIKSNLHKSLRILELILHKYSKLEEEKRVNEIILIIDNPEEQYKKVLEGLQNFQKFLIDLEVIVQNINVPSFEIPTQIPFNEVRLDLSEAIKDFDNGCFLSAQNMCRRAYEGALREKYKEIEEKEPRENFVCPSCRKIIRKNSEFSVTKLHKWAIEKKIIHEKLQNVGFLIPEIASGSAHPPEEPFPRDKQIAKLTIEATFALIIQIYSKK